MKRRARREGSHPDDGCGLRRRGPAGRRAGPHRENWPGVGVPNRRSRPSARRCRRWFRAPARCRSEAPTGRTGQRSERCRRWFRAPARCRSETGAPSVVGAGFALPRDAGRRPPPGELASAPSHADRVPEFHAVHTKSPPGGGCHGERRLPLPVGFRPLLAGVR